MREASAPRPWVLVAGEFALLAGAVVLVEPASAQVPSCDATLSGITVTGRAIPGLRGSVFSHASRRSTGRPCANPSHHTDNPTCRFTSHAWTAAW